MNFLIIERLNISLVFAETLVRASEGDCFPVAVLPVLVSLLLPRNGRAYLLVYLPGDLLELLGRLGRVAFEDHRGLLLREAVKAELFVDVEGLLGQELRELLGEVLVEGARVDD